MNELLDKDILILAHFSQAPWELGNGRFCYLADLMSLHGANVELMTSSFSHKSKTQRKNALIKEIDVEYKFTMLYEPSYYGNISLNRYYSHYIFGRNIKKYLRHRQKPDALYCAVPSLDAAYVAAKYSKKNRIPLIIDVQDLWPEAFKMVFRLPYIGDLILYPIKKRADAIYRMADDIIAVSETYAQRAMSVNSKCLEPLIVFLGTDSERYNTFIARKQNERSNYEEIWVAYVGTLGYSYDLYSVIDAIKILDEKGAYTIRLIVMGDGPLRNSFEEYSKHCRIKATFTGHLSYELMITQLTSCDIAINPIRKKAAQSIINKHADYAIAGLPVLNTQESLEYRQMIDKYEMGLNCENGNPNDIATKLELLCGSSELRKSMGSNSRMVFSELFDRSKTYSSIISRISCCIGK